MPSAATPPVAPADGERVRRPAILAVDDEPTVLAAVARDLRRGFGERYRILRALSGAERRSSGRSSRGRTVVVLRRRDRDAVPEVRGQTANPPSPML